MLGEGLAISAGTSASISASSALSSAARKTSRRVDLESRREAVPRGREGGVITLAQVGCVRRDRVGHELVNVILELRLAPVCQHDAPEFALLRPRKFNKQIIPI